MPNSVTVKPANTYRTKTVYMGCDKSFAEAINGGDTRSTAIEEQISRVSIHNVSDITTKTTTYQDGPDEPFKVTEISITDTDGNIVTIDLFIED